MPKALSSNIWTSAPIQPEPSAQRVDAAALDVPEMLAHYGIPNDGQQEWFLSMILFYLSDYRDHSELAGRWAIFRLLQLEEITLSNWAEGMDIPAVRSTPRLWERWRAGSSVTKDAAEAEQLNAREESEQRTAYGRDHHWLRQYDSQKPAPGKRHSLVAIQRSWNQMTDEERKAICATFPQKISDGGSGRAVVKQGIAQARRETRPAD